MRTHSVKDDLFGVLDAGYLFQNKKGEGGNTFEGISSKTIPSQSRETPVFAWSRVIDVSDRKVEVSTLETLVRSMAIQVNIS